MKARWAVLLSLTALVLGSCAPESEVAVAPVDLDAEQAAVEKVIDQLWESWELKDFDLLSRVMAHDADMLNFGTDAAERWVGWEALHDSMKKQLEAFESIGVSPVERVVKVHEGGSVAWFSSVMDVTVGLASGEAVDMEGTRFTGVLEKRDGTWLIVQIHASVPVAGQAAPY